MGTAGLGARRADRGLRPIAGTPRAFFRPGAREPWFTPGKLGGFIDDFVYDWRTHKIPPKQIAQASPLQFMILDAVDQAFRWTKYDKQSLNRSRIGVVVGTGLRRRFLRPVGHGPATAAVPADLDAGPPPTRRPRRSHRPAIAEGYQSVLLEHMPAMLDETGSFTSSSLASRITKTFDLMGGGVAVDAGPASALAALDCCVDQLLSGACEMMVCVGGQQDMGPTKLRRLGNRADCWRPAARPLPSMPRPTASCPAKAAERSS